MTKEYYEAHKEEIIKKTVERNKKYRTTPMGRAVRLISNYRQMDRRNGFDDTIDFDGEWIVEHIFSQPCAHCGETDWRKLGCNRIDNGLPHTKDNVEPCCEYCNNQLNYKDMRKKVGKFSLSGELLEMWNSLKDCIMETSLSHAAISDCCNNKYLREGNNIYQNHVWKYV
jgi:hypothetical protein